MQFLKAFFPVSFMAKDVKNLIIAIVLYVLLGVVAGLLCWLVGLIPLVGGFLSWLLGTVIGVYVTAGIVFSILVFVKVFK